MRKEVIILKKKSSDTSIKLESDRTITKRQSKGKGNQGAYA